MARTGLAKVSRYRVLPLVLLAISVVIALAIGLWLNRGAYASSADFEYFASTQHSVQGDFLSFFREHGGLEVFGYPITEQFSQDGRTIQYFQKARMELHPENAPENRIQLADIASQMGFVTPRIPQSDIPQGDPTRVYFPGTGHTVGLPFLRFFNEHGGQAVLGQPITEAEPVGTRGEQKQYFERARMDFNPDLSPGQQMELADLGQSHFVFAGIDSVFLRGLPPGIPNSTAVSGGPKLLLVDAHVADPNAASPQTQTVFVYVTDESDRPVKEVNVSYEIDYPDGSQSGVLPLTNEAGYASEKFQLKPVPPGQKLVIRVTVSWNSLTTSASISSLPRQ